MFNLQRFFKKKVKIPAEIIKQIKPILKMGGVGVLPTDTIYGIVGCALKEEAVSRIYKLRHRELKKPMIILLASPKDLELFDVKLSGEQQKILLKIWPGKVSVVLPCAGKELQHLNRGGKTLAFRMPDDKSLLSLLKKVGPLVAPSANFAGEKAAATCKEAKKYFADKIDFYVDAKKLSSKPSTLIEISKKGEIKVLRDGAVKIK